MGDITDRNRAKQERRRLRARPRLKLVGGRWYAFAPESGDARAIRAFLASAIDWCDQMNRKRGLSPRRQPPPDPKTMPRWIGP